MASKTIFTYKVVRWDAQWSADMQHELNALGSTGYELVAVAPSSHALDRPTVTAFLKRAEKEPQS